MPTTLTRFQEHVASILETDSVSKTNSFIDEIEGYGIDSVDAFEDAYYGCYPNVQTFAEDFVNEVYSHVINELPSWLQYAIDYEMIWYQTLRHDFFEIGAEDGFYIFNRNF